MEYKEWIIHKNRPAGIGRHKVKTYILGPLGMEYIWTPDKLSTAYEKLCEIRQLLDHGEIKSAYMEVEDWFPKNKSKATQAELAKAYKLLGFSLYRLAVKKEDGFKTKEEEGIRYLEKCAAAAETELSVHCFLYDHYKSVDPKKALGYLKTAFENNYAEAVTITAYLFLNGQKTFGNMTEELILKTASLLIDANISDMGSDIYFKVHITDENRDTVHKLLCEAPLFLPALKGAGKERFTNVILFGDSEMNYRFIIESIACAYLGKKHPISITLFGENADKLKNRLHQECPGLNDNTKIACIAVHFVKCSIRETDFPRLIYSDTYGNSIHGGGTYQKKEEDNIIQILKDGNYFIVDHSDDLENIRFAAELRTWLLRSRGTFDRAPFIAVKCADEQNSCLASHLTLSGQAAGNSYYNRYDLFPIGISSSTYSYKNIIEDPVLYDFALRIHKSYYGDNELAAENDFYSYSYNADSSLSTAIGLCYRFFAAGAAFADAENYRDFGFFKTPAIVERFIGTGTLENEAKITALAMLEQSRWNGFMLSRGWESADKSRVLAYKEQSTGSAHKHTLAKIHPFIREWNSSDDDDDDLSDILEILKSEFGYDRNPYQTTIDGVRDTVSFFEKSNKEEKTH